MFQYKTVLIIFPFFSLQCAVRWQVGNFEYSSTVKNWRKWITVYRRVGANGLGHYTAVILQKSVTKIWLHVNGLQISTLPWVSQLRPGEQLRQPLVRAEGGGGERGGMGSGGGGAERSTENYCLSMFLSAVGNMQRWSREIFFENPPVTAEQYFPKCVFPSFLFFVPTSSIVRLYCSCFHWAWLSFHSAEHNLAFT